MHLVEKLTNIIFLKKYIILPLLGVLFGVSINYFLIFSEQQEYTNYLIKDALLASLLGVFITVVISKTVKVLNKILPYQKKIGTRLFIGVLTHFIISFFITVFFFYVYKVYFFEVKNFIKIYYSSIIKLGIILLILTIVFEVIYFALYSYYSYSKLQIEIVKQERKQIELQLNALKSQLSPHFLFNSLNTISSLIYKDESSAEIFIRRLAKMYDFTLKSYHQKLITLQEEIDFVNAYIYLIQTRFKDKFSCIISIEDDVLETKIPPLTLQMLVENAVKHNQMSINTPLLISIKSNGFEVVVENNITKVPINITSFNIGLKNIEARYLLIADKAISIIKNEKFIVKLPLIR